MEESKVIFFNHHVGDGVHYINNNARSFPDGSSQLGDTSEGCILYNLEMLLSRHLIGDLTIEGVWNEVYPDDPMALNDVAYILFSNTEYVESWDPFSPENIADAIEDTRKMGCPKLADRFIEIFRQHGYNL